MNKRISIGGVAILLVSICCTCASPNYYSPEKQQKQNSVLYAGNLNSLDAFYNRQYNLELELSKALPDSFVGLGLGKSKKLNKAIEKARDNAGFAISRRAKSYVKVLRSHYTGVRRGRRVEKFDEIISISSNTRIAEINYHSPDSLYYKGIYYVSIISTKNIVDYRSSHLRYYEEDDQDLYQEMFDEIDRKYKKLELIRN